MVWFFGRITEEIRILISILNVTLFEIDCPPIYTGRSSLYKDERNGRYLLFVTKSAHTREDFNRVCNIASEYGVMENLTDVTIAYLEEHDGLIIKDDALQKLMYV